MTAIVLFALALIIGQGMIALAFLRLARSFGDYTVSNRVLQEQQALIIVELKHLRRAA